MAVIATANDETPYACSALQAQHSRFHACRHVTVHIKWISFFSACNLPHDSISTLSACNLRMKYTAGTFWENFAQRWNCYSQHQRPSWLLKHFNLINEVIIIDIAIPDSMKAKPSLLILCYLLEASDGELGIPPSPVIDLEDAVCLFPKETSEGLSQSPEIKFLGENWNFEDDFENYKKIAMYEDPWDMRQLQDYMNRDFFSQSILSDGDFYVAWRLETAGNL